MELPQRVLAVKLRTAIDRAMARPGARWVEAVQRLLAWSHHGPPAAVVDSVQAIEGAGRFDGFEQRPTA